jgi:hypothetical protein
MTRKDWPAGMPGRALAFLSGLAAVSAVALPSLAGVPITTTTTTSTTFTTTTTTTSTTATTSSTTSTTEPTASTTSTTMPEPDLTPIRACGDPSGDGQVTATDALFVLQCAVGVDDDCPVMTCDASGSGRNHGLHPVISASDALAVLGGATGLAPSTLRCPTAARIWDEQLLGAIRRDIPRPTVHARNLFHLSVALWDAWVAYDDETDAQFYLFSETPPAEPDVLTARSVAMSYASYRILSARFVNSPGKVASLAAFDKAMDDLGLDRAYTSTAGDSPAAVGNRIAAAVLAYGQADGANEAANYADTSGYVSVNPPLYPALAGAEMTDPSRWQPLSLKYSVTQNGIPLPVTLQASITPHWADVAEFALEPADPGPAPILGGEGDEEYKQSALQVLHFSSQLDPADDVFIDISPGAKGNNPLGTNDGPGHALNPATNAPYESNNVRLADWARVLAMFWADGPESETPPGHWNVIANYVADHPLFAKKLKGEGDAIDNLEWDVKVYLALNGAVHDAAISAWGNKTVYDSARPISMIRYMSGLGQSSLPDGPSYHPLGIPLEEGVVEVITNESVAQGERHAHLEEHVGEIAVRAWLGNPEHPATETGGVGWILGENWLPFQKDTFVTPAFPGYFSGHSTFSRSAAEAMTFLTGSNFFPGGLSEFHAPADTFLGVEKGPTEPITLQWATYQDAADQAGLSRLYGGIHVRADDFAGRTLGYDIGLDAAALAEKYWNGTVGD